MTQALWVLCLLLLAAGYIADPSGPVLAAGLAALRHILTADGKKLYSFTLEPGALRALDHAGEAFIAAQLERNFRTLDYYKSLIY